MAMSEQFGMISFEDNSCDTYEVGIRRTVCLKNYFLLF